MKTSMKSLIATGLIALSCTCSAFAAPTEEALVNEIGQRDGFYTFYPRMPITEFLNNWGNIPGWKYTPDPLNPPDNRRYRYDREYEITGIPVKESVTAVTYSRAGVVFSYGWTLSAKDSMLIYRIGSKILKRLQQFYPDAQKISLSIIGVNDYKPHFNPGRKDDTVYFYMVLGNDPEWPYTVALGYINPILKL